MAGEWVERTTSRELEKSPSRYDGRRGTYRDLEQLQTAAKVFSPEPCRQVANVSPPLSGKPKVIPAIALHQSNWTSPPPVTSASHQPGSTIMPRRNTAASPPRSPTWTAPRH